MISCRTLRWVVDAVTNRKPVSDGRAPRGGRSDCELFNEGDTLFTGADPYIKQIKLSNSVYVNRSAWSKLPIFAYNFVVYFGVIIHFAIWPGGDRASRVSRPDACDIQWCTYQSLHCQQDVASAAAPMLIGHHHSRVEIARFNYPCIVLASIP